MSAWVPRARALFRRRPVRLALVAVGLGLAGLAGYRLYAGRQVDRVWEDAQAALEADDLPTAAARLREYASRRPGDGAGHLALARTLRRLGEFEAADRHRTAAEAAGADPEAVRREGFLARVQQRGVRDQPTNELADLAGGRGAPDRAVLEALYRGDLAAREWDRAGYWLHWWLETHPDDWPPRLWQAELLERFRNYDRAREEYRRVLGRRADQPRALLGLGRAALAARGEYAEAETYLRRFLGIEPTHAEARLALARCRFARGDLAGARDLAGAVLADHPGHAGAALLRGTVEVEAGRDAEAADWLGRAAAAGADPAEADYQLALVLRRLGRAAEADAAHQRFEARRRLRWEIEAAAREAEAAPKDAGRQYEAGRLSLAAGEEDAAARWFRQALRVDPGHRPSHAALAEYYARDPDPAAQARAAEHRRRAGP